MIQIFILKHFGERAREKKQSAYELYQVKKRRVTVLKGKFYCIGTLRLKFMIEEVAIFGFIRKFLMRT